MLINDKLSDIGISPKTKQVAIVCPTAVGAYSGAEVQCLELLRLVRQFGADVRLISLNSKCSARYHSGNIATKLLLLLLLLPSILRVRRSSNIVLWGLPAMLAYLPLMMLPLRSQNISCTERQWSSAAKSRSWVYMLYGRQKWFFNSSYVMNGFINEGIVDPRRSSIFLNVKNREIQIARRTLATRRSPENSHSISSLEHIWVGRITREKDLELAILYCAKNSVKSLTVFGRIEDPLYLAELKNRAKDAGVVLKYAGYKSRSEIFSGDRLLIHTSRAEGMPNSVLDAIIFGTPVLSVPCDFLRDLDFPCEWYLNGESPSEPDFSDFGVYRDKVCSELYVESDDG